MTITEQRPPFPPTTICPNRMFIESNSLYKSPCHFRETQGWCANQEPGPGPGHGPFLAVLLSTVMS
ncbi:hypothetical protein B0T13DRAFT_468093 [Neurospora crassa]|nr:hypothetical protein B0T13DRAFT_468093 [Neurospora crassa]